MHPRIRAMVWFVAAICVAAQVASAQVSPRFDFLGFVPAVPVIAGEPIELLAVVQHNDNVRTPIPVAFMNTELTLVVRARLASNVGLAQAYSTATVEIYADVGPVSHADYAKRATFHDGELLLSGVFEGPFRREPPAAHAGRFLGSVTWTGGTRLHELGRNTSYWSFGGAVSTTNVSLPSGFSESWEGLIGQMVVADDARTWSAVKALYR